MVLGIRNVMDAESSATKIRIVGHDVTTLEQPLSSSLGKIATLEYDITQMMLEWFRAQQGNDRILLGGLQKLQEDTAWAFVYVQAKAWL